MDMPTGYARWVKHGGLPVMAVVLVLCATSPLAAQPQIHEVPPAPQISLNDSALGREILAALGDTEATPEQWQLRFRQFLSASDFMEDHIPIWQAAYLRFPDSQDRLVTASGLYAAEALAVGLASVPPKSASAWTALGWLADLAPNLNREAYDLVNAGMTRAFAGRAPEFRHVLQGDLDSTALASRTAMQTCLILALYGPPEDVCRWLRLPEKTVAFLEATGIWLFEGGRLTEAQTACLESLLVAVPRGHHSIVAVVVSDQPDYADRMDLQPPGQVIAIAPVPLEEITDPLVWPVKGKRKSAPLFTVQAAAVVMEAVQETQFDARPELRARRDDLIRSAGNHRERYLSAAATPAQFQEDPGLLLPLTSQLWFMDAEAMYLYSLELLDLEQYEPLNTLLLIADMLSLGGTQTPLLRIKEDGRVEATLIPVAHATSPRGKALSGISLDERWWRFSLTPQGHAIAYQFVY